MTIAILSEKFAILNFDSLTNGKSLNTENMITAKSNAEKWRCDKILLQESFAKLILLKYLQLYQYINLLNYLRYYSIQGKG